ncbi:MAG: hypothetical protein F6K11_22775 [Leptolyngbya sp. SIO3F4]|nr:hypothetical protein [Leptolyngbya sp. SIO3F4]
MIDRTMQYESVSQEGYTADIVSVSNFFEQINWYGSKLSDVENVLIENTPYETVGQFFSTFPWQSTANTLASDNAQAESSSESLSIEEDTLTLDDLSALF